MFELTYFFKILSLWPWPVWKRLLSGAFLFQKHTLFDMSFDNYNSNIGRDFFILLIDLLLCTSFWFLFVCLFGNYRPTLKFFHSYGDVTITGERLENLNYAWHSWPLSSEGSLECQTYCDMGYPFLYGWNIADTV